MVSTFLFPIEPEETTTPGGPGGPEAAGDAGENDEVSNPNSQGTTSRIGQPAVTSACLLPSEVLTNF